MSWTTTSGAQWVSTLEASDWLTDGASLPVLTCAGVAVAAPIGDADCELSLLTCVGSGTVQSPTGAGDCEIPLLQACGFVADPITGDAACTVPLITLSAAASSVEPGWGDGELYILTCESEGEFATHKVSAELPQLVCSAESGAFSESSIPEISCLGFSAFSKNSAELELPLFICEASAGAFADTELPALLAEAVALTGSVLSGTSSIPSLTCAALANNPPFGQSGSNLTRLLCAASGSCSGINTAELELPALKCVAVGFSSRTNTCAGFLKTLVCTGAAHFNPSGAGDCELYNLELTAFAVRESVYVDYSLQYVNPCKPPRVSCQGVCTINVLTCEAA